jgi:hypothetical protein
MAATMAKAYRAIERFFIIAGAEVSSSDATRIGYLTEFVSHDNTPICDLELSLLQRSIAAHRAQVKRESQEFSMRFYW